MTNNWRAFFAMVLMSVSPALAVIIKDSSSVAGAAYYGITDSVANLSDFVLFGRGLCGSPRLGRQGTSIYGDSRARQRAS